MVDGPVVWGSQVRSRQPGVFIVESPVPSDSAPIDIVAVRGWVERVPTLTLDGERPVPTALADRLASFWVPGQPILYVGRTSKSLGARVGALYATRLGDRRPHPGGHWLKTLRGLDRLRLWWAETDAPEEYEDALVTAFAAAADRGVLTDAKGLEPILPFANLETVTGDRRQHGIEGSLVDAVAGESAAAGGSTAAARRRAPAARSTVAGRTAPRRTATRAAAGPTRPMPDHAQLSAEGLARLHAELAELRAVQRPQVISRVAAARALGDLRENADYEAARNEQSFLEGRIRSLEALLANAQVIDSDHTGEVMLGSTVELDHEGEHITYRIVGSAEASPAEGSISNVSPVGKALVGHRAGEEVIVQLPGREMRYRIVEVR